MRPCSSSILIININQVVITIIVVFGVLLKSYLMCRLLHVTFIVTALENVLPLDLTLHLRFTLRRSFQKLIKSAGWRAWAKCHLVMPWSRLI